MPEKRRVVGQVFMAGAIVILLANVVLYSQGRGRPALGAVGASLLVLAIAVLAGTRKGGGSSS